MTPNLIAVEDLERDFAPLDVVLAESGGDNLTATFSPVWVDAQIFVLDVAGGGDVARKGGPGIARADLLVVNKRTLPRTWVSTFRRWLPTPRRLGVASLYWRCRVLIPSPSAD